MRTHFANRRDAANLFVDLTFLFELSRSISDLTVNAGPVYCYPIQQLKNVGATRYTWIYMITLSKGHYTLAVKLSDSAVWRHKKCKAVPLQAWTGPEGSRKLRLPHFVTLAQDGDGLSALSTGRLYARKYSWYSFLLEAESTIVRSEGFYVNEKSTNTRWDRTNDLPICSTAP